MQRAAIDADVLLLRVQRAAALACVTAVLQKLCVHDIIRYHDKKEQQESRAEIGTISNVKEQTQQRDHKTDDRISHKELVGFSFPRTEQVWGSFSSSSSGSGTHKAASESIYLVRVLLYCCCIVVKCFVSLIPGTAVYVVLLRVY